MTAARRPAPFVSVIIPTLNEERYVGLLLQDLAAQTYNDFEVIVSDSDSDDETIKVAETFKEQLELKTVTVDRISAGHGRNAGAKLAQGTFLLFLDADERIKTTFLEELVGHQQKLKADVLTTHIRTDGLNPIDHLITFFDSRAFQAFFKKRLLLMCGGIQFVRKSLHEKVEGFKDEMKIEEDMDYSKRLQRHTNKFYFIKELHVVTSSRRLKEDGRLRLYWRRLAWQYNLQSKEKLIENTKFGHYQAKSRWNWLRRLGFSLVVMVGIIFLIGTFYAWQHNDEPNEFGVSFSTKYAEELGLDWEQTLRRSASELPIPHYRIMSYWDRLQSTSPDVIDFSELDRQLVILRDYERTATVVLGQRQPRWPECHVPEWYEQFTAEEQRVLELNYIRLIIERYELDPVITSWQLDNEPANRNFGDCPEFDRSFYRAKYQLIQSLSDKPIVITASNQSGWPVQGPTGDKTGFSVYKEAYFDEFGRSNSWSFWYVPSWWHGFRAAMTELMHGDTNSFVHELQTEPWGPEATVSLSREEQDALFSPDELERNVRFATQTGMNEFWLWGVEYWMWRDQEFEDNSYLKAAADVLTELSDR